MEVLKILEKPQELDRDYDEEADMLYISVEEPQAAVGKEDQSYNCMKCSFCASHFP